METRLFRVDMRGRIKPLKVVDMKTNGTIWVYINSEPGLWTVGFYGPDGGWHSDSDHTDREEAAKRVHFLNGGPVDWSGRVRSGQDEFGKSGRNEPEKP